MGQGFTQNLGGLVTCRALMGFFESGFVPGDFPEVMEKTRSDSSSRLCIPDWIVLQTPRISISVFHLFQRRHSCWRIQWSTAPMRLYDIERH